MLTDGLEELGSYAFRECFSLKEIMLPATMKTIGTCALDYCENLKDVTCMATTPPAYKKGNSKLYGSECPMDLMTLHVPAEAVALYKAAAGWKDFGTIVAIDAPAVVEPRSADDPLPTVEELAGVDLTDAIVDGVYYNLDENAGSGVKEDAEGNACIVIGETTDMAAIANTTPGEQEMAEKFKGIVILLEAGKGVLSIDAKTVGANMLAVKIGDGEEYIFKSVEKGTAKVVYDVKEPTFAYIYAVSNKAGDVRRAATAENGVMIYSIELKEPETLRGDLNGDGSVNVTDVTALINHILGKSEPTFNAAAADLTGDGVINVTDVSKLIEIILGKE